MTPAEATRRSRRAQGLPDTIDDAGVLDVIAAFVAATSASAGSGAVPQSEPFRARREALGAGERHAASPR